MRGLVPVRANVYTLPMSPPTPMSAPATIVSPSIASERPSWSDSALTEPISFPVSRRAAAPVRVNVYSAPAARLPPTVTPTAPATIPSPSIATVLPRLSNAEAIGDGQLGGLLTVGGAGPRERVDRADAVVRAVVGAGAPATIVSPSIATDGPSSSPAARSEVVSFAVCVQLSPERVNT